MFYILTYGCAANKADTVRIVHLLRSHGWEKILTPDDATLLIVNTCGVKVPTRRKVFKKLKQLIDLDKPLIIAGCLPDIDPQTTQEILENVSKVGVIDTKSIHQLMLAVESVIDRNERIEINDPLSETVMEKSKIISTGDNPVIGIVQVAEGCSGNCSYCGTRLARGRLVSFPFDRLLFQVNNYLNSGLKEIWITAQDTGAYNYHDNRITDLLKAISQLKGDFFVRLGMINPHYLKNIEVELAYVLNSPKIFSFLHIPVQSGSDVILEKMNRKYTVNDFKETITYLRNSVSNLTISTDLIVGFPEEDENDFQSTLDLVDWLKPDIVNISRFGLVPGTKAGDFKQVQGGISKERSRKLKLICEKNFAKKNQNWLNWEGTVLIDKIGKRNTMIGRNYAYKPIVIHDNIPLGSFVNIRVYDLTNYYLLGRLTK